MNQTLPSTRGLPNGRVTGVEPSRVAPSHPDWKAWFASDLRETVVRDGWCAALWAIAAIHLIAFGITQVLYDPKRDSDPRLLLLWVAELAICWCAFRVITGRWGYSAKTAAGVVMRVWVTFFILVFNSILMNVQSGWAIHWYRLAWPTLSTFGFATLAWLISYRFLIPAVWMWLTGLLIVRFPHSSYAIYGVSWSVCLAALAISIDRATRVPARSQSTSDA